LPNRPAGAIFATMSKQFHARTPKPAKPRAGSAERPQAAGVDRAKLDRAAAQPVDAKAGTAKEVGGPDGPEPTRYGDWERGGICYDF